MFNTNTQRMLEVVTDWRGISMKFDDKIEFTYRAAKLRFGDEREFNPGDLLRSRRMIDDGNELWSIFNRVQENITKGGFRGYGERRRVSRLKNIHLDLAMNQGLWQLAEDYAAGRWN